MIEKKSPSVTKERLRSAYPTDRFQRPLGPTKNLTNPTSTHDNGQGNKTDAQTPGNPI